jgi:hypothetical protein
LALSKAPSIRHPSRSQKQGQVVGSLLINQMAEEDKKRFSRFDRNQGASGFWVGFFMALDRLAA